MEIQTIRWRAIFIPKHKTCTDWQSVSSLSRNFFYASSYLIFFFTTLHLLLMTKRPQIKRKHTKSKPQQFNHTNYRQKCQGSNTRKVSNMLLFCCAWVSQINFCTLESTYTGYWQEKLKPTQAVCFLGCRNGSWTVEVLYSFIGYLRHLLF